MGKKQLDRTKVFFVAGMHRSGTSLMAMWLKNIGLNFGGDLLGSSWSNKYGHFENIELLNYSKNILKRNGLPRDGLEMVNFKNIKLTEPERESFLRIIDNYLVNDECFVWKEPRSTLLISEYKKMVDLKVVAIFRHPREVVQSLIKRDKYQHPSGRQNFRSAYKVIDRYYLNKKILIKKYLNDWEVYNKSIIKFHKNYPDDIFIINFHSLQEEDATISKRLGDFLDIQVPYGSFGKIFDRTVINTSKNHSINSDLYQELKSISC